MRCLSIIYKRHIELLLSGEGVVFGEFLVDACREITIATGSVANAAI